MNSAAGPGRLVVTFWGAAQSVTGSMHLVEAGGRRILLDCGLTRDPRHHPHPRGPFPFDPHALDAVVLSHAHIDHCGNLPRLVGQGYDGPIYCTPATRDLIALMLHQSARFLEEEAFVQSIIGGREAPPQAGARAVVERALKQCIAVPYNEPWEVARDVEGLLVSAGHILGSASVVLGCGGSRSARLAFTGDLGRRGAPLLPPPAPVPVADLLLTECTYGGRTLAAVTEAVGQLEEVVRRTVERGGKVLAPAFSLGRTQVLTHVLTEALRAGRLPAVPVYVDSPLAADIAAVYGKHPASLNRQAATLIEEGDDFLGGPMVHYIRSAEESRELAARRDPCVVVAPGGMCEGGRILQHLKHHIDDPRCAVVLVSYQAPHTPGRRLLERGPTVRFHGRKWNKWAEVVYLAGFSGHADHNDLLAYLAPLAGRATKVCLVHGEPEQAAALSQDLRQRGVADVAVPGLGETVSGGPQD
jgi:metallo-beta-lactamase family protein